ncbi:hypothetical protein GO755_32875 [Spirosoma sp. HMF4905]|uniref:Uncharacterized protein n=1 Tax=Spirosoma arboris TaxID=2682092 RepID=A0A7K1SM41_9BACT|nr:hypothetical protein [Spirosoma arboris]MVM34869.1 hypothetical protein [Spirosoma arboris]
MAKLQKYPKALKAGASLKSLQNWEARNKKVKAKNDAIMKDRNAKKAVRDRVAKMKK